jgi:hypothetical protein
MIKKFGVNFSCLFFIFFLTFFFFNSERMIAQSYTYKIKNDVQTSDRTMEFDLYLLNTNPSIPIEISVAQAGILVNPEIKNGGNITASLVAGASEMVAAQVPSSITFASATNCIKIAAKAIPGCGSGTTISTTGLGTRLCRVRLTNTVPFGIAKANLTFNFTAVPYNTFIGMYRSDCTGSDQLPIDGTIGTSQASNPTLNGIPLTITGVTASSKVYDGNTSATLSGGTLSGVIGTDDVTIVPGTGTFSDKNVGSPKTVTAVGYSITGNDAQKYTLTAQPSGITADITVKGLTISDVTADDKPYDGNTTAVLKGGTLVGVISPDVVNITYGTGTFSDKEVGNLKTVTATGYSIEGTDATNYILSEQPTGIKASITAPAVIKLSLKVFLQGLYNATNGNMNKCKDYVSTAAVDKFSGNISDYITVELRNATNYATVEYTATSIELHQDGTCNSEGLSYIAIPALYSGSYYITIKTRNHVQITTPTAISFEGDAISYDFSDAASKAYGNNQKLLKTGVYGMYRGDINQDGSVTVVGDRTPTNMKSLAVAKGFSKEDVNGDGFITVVGDRTPINMNAVSIIRKKDPLTP